LKERQRGEDPQVALITPWVIPLDELEFRSELLRSSSETQPVFQRIYEQDVKPHSTFVSEVFWTSRFPRDMLSRVLMGILARTIWLYTIPARGYKSSERLKLYPAISELPVIVYDPLSLGGVPGADVVNALSQLADSSTYLNVMENRVFYVLLPDIQKFLRERYHVSTEFDALGALEKLMHQANLRPGRKFKIILPVFTSK